MKAKFEKYILKFKNPSETSRGTLIEKQTYILTIENKRKKGIGECNLFKGLSADDLPNYEEILEWTCENILLRKEILWEKLRKYPSIQFGLEQAFLNIEQEKNIYFPSDFTLGKKGIPINGLIWMGSIEFMKQQFYEKFENGYRCIKFKIGTNWNKEYQLLTEIRNQFPKEKLEIRVDANGAFSFDEAIIVLNDLEKIQIHSIEQPIKRGNHLKMKKLCNTTPIPIALDEELIGIFQYEDKKSLLDEIQPQYIILKPALVGGFKGCEEWISIANQRKIKWWITSALESNIGLNAIAQWTFLLQNNLPQGLGTGGLYTNNFPSELYIDNAELKYHK